MTNGLCPNCGATVNIPEGVNEVQCEYCKTLVKNEEATHEFKEVSRTPYGSLLLIADTALEAGNFSEAYTYYNKVIEISPTFADAWLKKGIAMVRMSTVGNLKIKEAIGSWKAAMKWAKKPESMKKRVALEINNVVTDFYPVLESHFFKFRTTDDAITEHLDRFITFEAALDYAVQLDKDSMIIRNALSLCDKVLLSTNSVISQNINEEAQQEIERRNNLNSIRNIGEGNFSKFLNSVKTYDENIKTAKEAASRIQSANDKLLTMILKIKSKYQNLLAEVDPQYALGLKKEKEAKEKELEAKKQEIQKNKINDDALFFGGCIGIISIVAIPGCIANMGFDENTKETFMTIAIFFGIMIGIIAYFWRKKCLEKAHKNMNDLNSLKNDNLNSFN